MDYNNAISATPKSGGSVGGIDNFDAAVAAPGFEPVPGGVYTATVSHGEVMTTRKGDDGYRMRFVISEGPHANRVLTRIWTFSERAMPYSKRDLAAFGLTKAEQLLSPFPEDGKTYVVRLVVCLQRDNDGVERNDIKRIDVLRVADSPAAKFMLPADGEGEAV